jgi:hypothetical protein
MSRQVLSCVKWPGHEDNSPPSSAKVKNEWSNTSSPVCLHSVERKNFTLTVWSAQDENILRRFERKIFRRIYGPVRQGREWRIRNNEEIDNIIRKKDIIRFVKARRISWIGHVERMEDSRMPRRVMREKIYTRR